MLDLAREERSLPMSLVGVMSSDGLSSGRVQPHARSSDQAAEPRVAWRE